MVRARAVSVEMEGKPAKKASPVGGYRPDIDGMRTIAIIGVLLFHIDHTWMPGGFVGVDIFLYRSRDANRVFFCCARRPPFESLRG